MNKSVLNSQMTRVQNSKAKDNADNTTDDPDKTICMIAQRTKSNNDVNKTPKNGIARDECKMENEMLI